jgi:hypothetical protein
MSWFSRPSQVEEFADAIRPELLESPVPLPRPDLLERVIASRDSGTRVILPDVAQAPSAAPRRLLVPALIAAALLMMIVPFRMSERIATSGDDPSSLSRIANDWLSGSVAFAQTDASRAERKTAPIAFVRPGRIHPIRLEYIRTWRDPAQKETSRLNGTVIVTRTVQNGTPAFLVVSRNEGSRDGRAVFTLDSVAIAQINLKLLHHTALERPFSRYDEITIDQSFRGDSVIGHMRAKKNGAVVAERPIAQRLAASSTPYIVDALGPILLGTANLHAGWSGSASMVGWAVRNDDVFSAIEIRVDGEETVTVPAGRFDCWRLSIRVAGGSVTNWVRKSDGIGVRGIEHEASGASHEVVLSKIDN